MDVCVKPGIKFHTDHRLVQVKLRFAPCSYRCASGSCVVGSAFARKPPPLNVTNLQLPAVPEQFNDLLSQMHAEELTDTYAGWEHGVFQAGKTTVGIRQTQNLPQWKLDHAAELQALSDQCKQAFLSWQKGGDKADYQAVYLKCKHGVHAIMNRWWSTTAAHIQEQVDSKQPQHQHAGFRTLRAVLASGQRPAPHLKDAQGNSLHTKTGRVLRWQEYFQDLLNVCSVSHDHFVAGLQSCPVNQSLADLPTFSETLAAVRRIKPKKACGPDGVPGDLLRNMSLPNLRVLHEHMVRVWVRAIDVPKAWQSGFLVPLPKAGDLSSCSNWRGITLLSVPGKLFARVIASRLQDYAETHGLVPEWQCGFRSGRSTTDMIFTLRMILDTANHKKLPLFVLFVDLVKAYDSVSRKGLWNVLKAKGVPADLLYLIRGYYSNKTGRVATEGVLSPEFTLETGLGQGCCLAPLLFNIYFGAVMETWLASDPQRIQWATRIDGLLRRQADLSKYALYTHHGRFRNSVLQMISP